MIGSERKIEWKEDWEKSDGKKLCLNIKPVYGWVCETENDCLYVKGEDLVMERVAAKHNYWTQALLGQSFASHRTTWEIIKKNKKW